MSQLFISAAHKSSGKTTVTLGLCAAFSRQGLKVQPFKKGPDYIDPMWHGQAAGRACYNLDFYTQSEDEVLATFVHYTQDADLTITEGNKGLYDGLDVEGGNSNAALAKLLKAPVILVLDTRGTIRGIAPLLIGYQVFDPQINIAGVILNQVGGSRHESKLRAVVERYTDIPVVGAIRRDPRLELVERHLGLMPSNEDSHAMQRIDTIGELVAAQVDLNRLQDIAVVAPVPQASAAVPVAQTPASGVRIGIARDAAFGFYYPGDLQALQQAGAELVPVDMLRDRDLPDIDGLFIGGGFPETQMQALEANSAMRSTVRNAIESGLPVYAECGGLMYLSRSIEWQGRCYEMVGVIPGDAVMHERPQGRGYVRLEETGNGPWGNISNTRNEIAAHEFHYSSLINMDKNQDYAFRVKRGSGIDGEHDGIVYKNLLACYAHLRNTQQSPWAPRFVEFVAACRQKVEQTADAV